MAKSAPAKKAASASPAKKIRTKSEIYKTLAELTDLSRKQVVAVFDGMSSLIRADLSAKGPGVFNVPGLMKITLQKKPATKGGMRPDPFRPGQMMQVAPKPARKVVKVRALKGLKEMV